MSCLPETRLTLISDDDAEVFVVRGDFQLEQRGVGRLTTHHALPAGLYKLKVVRAGQVAERLVELPGDGDTFDVRVPVIETVLPMRATFGGMEKQIRQLERTFRSMNRVSLGRPDLGRLAMPIESMADMGLEPEGAPAAEGVVEATGKDEPANGELVLAGNVDSGLHTLFSTVRILPESAFDMPLDGSQPHIDAGKVHRLDLEDHRFKAARVSLPQGIYHIVATISGTVTQVTVPVLRNRQTRVFLRREVPGPDRSSSRSERVALSIEINRPSAAFFPGKEDEVSEVVRAALARGRKIIVTRKAAEALLPPGNDDPLTAIAGVHLMLAALESAGSPGSSNAAAEPEFRMPDVAEMLKAMRKSRVLGRHADPSYSSRVLPDIIALHLRAGLLDTQLRRVSRPPLFWESWRVLVADQAQHVVLDTALLAAAPRAFALGPYLVFARLEMAGST